MMTAKEQRILILKGAIGHASCVIREPWQSVESYQTALANIKKYEKELKELEGR